MLLKELLSPTLKDFRKEREPMVVTTADSEWCQETVTKGWLSEEQMHHAAERYRLGKSRSGKTIFWMIDDLGFVLDGHIGEAWASTMLKTREPKLLSHWHPRHCLFGLHLLTENCFKGHTALELCSLATEGTQESTESTESTERPKGHMERIPTDHAQPVPKAHSVISVNSVCNQKPVCVVEAEKSAVILSERLPKMTWLATAYPANLTVEKFEPLQGRKVVLFPPCDPDGETFFAWLEVADRARHLYQIDVSVSDFLEIRASEAQKAQKIDLVDFIFQL